MSLNDLTDDELFELGEAVHDELRARALARHEPAALADQAFAMAFDSKGWPGTPELLDGLLICCGGLKGRPGGHRCSFTSLDERWVWEHGYEIDDVRRADETTLRTVTILAARQGSIVTQVESRCDQMGHHRTGALSWKVAGNRLEPTDTPSRVPENHRR